jgi:hypothetical protein
MLLVEGKNNIYLCGEIQNKVTHRYPIRYINTRYRKMKLIIPIQSMILISTMVSSFLSSDLFIAVLIGSIVHAIQLKSFGVIRCII